MWKEGGEKKVAFESNLENINSDITKKYMKEVISSYENKNYRSAIVMLYTVFLTDLCEKLKELKDLYADDKAEEILTSINSLKKDNPTRENQLISKIECSKPELLADEARATFEYLKNWRNLCAHPSLDIETIDPLAEPSLEVVAALIKSSIDTLFSKSAYLGKKIFGNFLQDLATKKDSLVSDDALEVFLKQRYLSKFDKKTKGYIIKELFKIIFITSNEEACSHRDFNYKVLLIMIKKDKSSLRDEIIESAHFNNIAIERRPQLGLFMNFLSRFPHLYLKVSKHIKDKIMEDSKIDVDSTLYITNYYIYESDLKTHLEQSAKDDEICRELNKFKRENVQFLKDLAIEENCLNDLWELGISIYSNSESFDVAIMNFNIWIEQRLVDFDYVLLELLASKTIDKSQCNERNAARRDYGLVVDKYNTICREEDINKLNTLNPIFPISNKKRI